MPYSMTGFATAEAGSAPFQLSWEIRSVNHRFLDVSFRLPDELRPMEPALRDLAGRFLNRGKVDCTLRVSLADGATARSQVDPQMLASLAALQQHVVAEFAQAEPLSVAEILRWPGVLSEPEQDLSQLAAPAESSFERAVEALREARAREGARIGEMLSQRTELIGTIVTTLRPRLAGASARHRGKLLERIDRLEIQVQPERLEQEVALIAQRIDVTEEVDRIDSHLVEIRDVLTRDEPIGRRLDFLIQELNREANTFGSKAQEEELTRYAVDLKVLIEQMREQVQNLE
jgi:uncharacterized protein (TIGR00255 family)